MDLRHLQCALAVARAGSITKAAKNLYTAQPNLSKSLRELEAEVGSPLFLRRATGVALTARGYEFLGCAQAVVNQFNALENRFRSDRGGMARRDLSITATRSSYVSAAVAELLNRFMSGEGALLHVKFKEGAPADAIRDVFSGEADLGVLRCNDAASEYFRNLARSGNLTFTEVGSCPFEVLMSRSHPLADEPVLRAELLEPHPEVIDAASEALSFPCSPGAADAGESGKKLIYCYDRASAMDQLSCVRGSYMWAAAAGDRMLNAYGLVKKNCRGVDRGGSLEAVVYRDKVCLNDFERAFVEILSFNWKEGIVNAGKNDGSPEGSLPYSGAVRL